jgi:hypothetical protein
MSAPAVIKATFADWRTIKGRKQLQLHFEVPIELQAQVLTYLGAPDPTNPKWCAIALLDMSKASKPEQPKERRRFDELPPPQQAGIICAEPSFWAFIREEHGMDAYSAEDAAHFVREYCGVASRSQLTAGLSSWKSLRGRYQAWKVAA